MLLVALAAAVLVAACGRPETPEEAIRAMVEAAEQAAEGRDASGLVALVADEYRDGSGNDAEGIRRYLRGYLLAHQSVHLVTRIEEIELVGNELARVHATVGMLGREAAADSPLELAGEVLELELRLALEDGEWKVTRADWR